MDPNRSETAQPLVALARMLEGMAQMQERQAAVHAEQMEALRAQASLQTQALRQLAAAGETSSRDPPSRSPLRIHIPKMTAEDDIQAFVESFEVAAEACQWPHEEWVVHLLPLLTGEAQQAAHGLPPGARADYKIVKRAILDRLGCSTEDYRRRFRTAKLVAEDRPFAYAQRLTHMARRWLQPETRSAGGVVEQVILEQFLEGLPEGTANWVRCHRPTNLEGAVTLAEDHLVLYPSAQQQARPEPAPRRRPPPRAGPFPVPRALPPPLPQTNPPFFSDSLSRSRLSGGGLRLAEGASDARTGVLAVRTAGSPAPRLSTYGSGAGGPGGRAAHFRSRSGGSVLHPGTGCIECVVTLRPVKKRPSCWYPETAGKWFSRRLITTPWRGT
ncbi:uncharacterized protein LOC118231294 isoform X1 [Anguilla anguilla]|uniref:uncharacterized protein LOC118231294 isoform X1 n=1 Tax=Anguilla anguilla TaxID=7936 RepID=UPI0015B01243|nr:uncharacterized protein LOC118231294 isoform X1 [Anguilla anguilla]